MSRTADNFEKFELTRSSTRRLHSDNFVCVQVCQRVGPTRNIYRIAGVVTIELGARF